jgi:hypothetical protein
MDAPEADATKKSDCEDKWKSKIKGTHEGFFHNLKVDADGNITGKFEGKDIIGGKCVEPVGGEHTMTLTRDDVDFTYEYSGVITPLSATDFECKGSRTSTPKHKPRSEEYEEDKARGKEKLADPEEWIAEKTT